MALRKQTPVREALGSWRQPRQIPEVRSLKSCLLPRAVITLVTEPCDTGLKRALALLRGLSAEALTVQK